jgi:hypothetical protein
MTNPIRNYADVEDIVTQNWPNRESMIRAEGADPGRFKRLLGLVVSDPWVLVIKLIQPSGHTRSPGEVLVLSISKRNGKRQQRETRTT